MPSFPKPSFTFDYDADAERAALRQWRDTQPGRAIPAKDDNRLLLATWNIANLGAQDRGPKDYALLAEVISWFDLVAVQEVKNNRRGLDGLMAALPASWRTVYSDAAGNDERMTFVYDSEKVKPRELTGEVAVAPSDLKNVTLPETTVAKFAGFDRNPYIVSFQAGTMVFCLVNVHLYYGDDTAIDAIERRALEAFAVAQWCKRESKSHYALTPIIAALGDFNLPKIDPADQLRTKFLGVHDGCLGLLQGADIRSQRHDPAQHHGDRAECGDLIGAEQAENRHEHEGGATGEDRFGSQNELPAPLSGHGEFLEPGFES